MKFSIPEISWHNRDPVLSVDFQPKCKANDPLRLATGGTDSHVLIWYISVTDTGSVNLEVAADLTRHQKAVNIVRWSPNGLYLASGDDESIIFIWKQKSEESGPSLEGEDNNKETWVIHKTLRGHMEDVLDLSWNSLSTQLASGSVDNKLIVWDVEKGKYKSILSDHKGFVQGVAWDPKGQFIVSACSDRVFRTFDVSTKKVVSRSSKAILPFPNDHALHGTNVRLFYDDTLQTYYRRLHFSPDGLFIAVPGGRIESEQAKLDIKPINAAYIYTRYSLKVPAVVLPCGEAPLAARWSPLRYGARRGTRAAALPAPRRLLALATRRALLLYDTHQRTPVALISNIHYTRLTDLTWSPDGRILVASSTDGFCSIVTFDEGELGEVEEEEVEESGPEPVETNEEPQNEKEEEPKPIEIKPKSKIGSFIKFKTPNEKSPKWAKIETKDQKPPVKIDVFIETAMPSWSDNSSNDIIKPSEPMDVDRKDEITVIEDSEDIKLVYEETEGTKSGTQSPKEATSKENQNESISNDNTRKNTLPNQSNFFKHAKVTDIKEPLSVKSVVSSKAPKRVNFVTLSSPKTKKK